MGGHYLEMSLLAMAYSTCVYIINKKTDALLAYSIILYYIPVYPVI